VTGGQVGFERRAGVLALRIARGNGGRRWGLAEVVLGVALAFVTVLAVILGLLIWQGYDGRIERAKTQAEIAAHVVAVHAQWLIETSRQALRRIDGQLGPRLDGPVTSESNVREELAGMPAEVRLGIYDRSGSRFGGDFDAPATIAGEEYVEALREGAEWHISSLIPSTDDAPTRFAIARRLERNGTFAGIAALHISAGVMGSFWSALELGPGSTVSVTRTDGWLIARFPPINEPLDGSGAALITTFLPAADAGSYATDRSIVDGTPRIIGYRKLPGLQVVAVASVSTATVLAEYWRGVTIVLALIVPLMIAVGAGAIWLSRLMRRDEKARLALSQANEDNKMLMREIHHRVKNNLQAVSSLVQLQPLAPAAKQEMARRIAAMVSVHEHIYRSDQFTNPQVDSYIRTIVENARQGFDQPLEISYDIAPLRVDVDHAMPLGLIVSEVVSNALKHGFPDGRQGKLQIALSAAGDDLQLVISDNGVGFDPAGHADGMGRRLVEGLTGQLGGQSSYDQDGGTRFTLVFPRSSRRRDDV
jgi:two-component system, sensor histidine kinase PdtaS